MWRLVTPSIDAAKYDAHVTVVHCRELDTNDEAKLKALYQAYHDKQGKVSDEDLASLDAKKEILKAQYSKTSGKEKPRVGQMIGKDKPLVYMRKALMKGIRRCPMCSILPVTDLDHVWPESDYGQLAVCRLNLVPLCGKCNNEKRKRNPTKFIHTYYQQFPEGVAFFVAKCKVVAGKIIARFCVDQGALRNTDLSHTLHLQMANIKLRLRLQGASQEFFMKLFRNASVKTNEELHSFLNNRLRWYEKPENYGRNDWRTALIRGMIECHDIDVAVVRGYQTARPIRREMNI